MEKQTARFSRKQCLGLLVFFLLSSICVLDAFCQGKKPSWQYVQSLHFAKTKEIYFTAEDSYFTVDIEGVNPEDVSVFVNDVPRNVSFVSSRKESYLIPGANPLDDGIHGCRIVIAFRFTQPGYFHIMPIDVRVNDMYNRIAVDNVRVYENPNTVQPELFLQFDDPRFNTSGKKLNVKSGDHIAFTLYIRYAVQLINFNWKIPEDSLFTEVERYEITKGNPRGTEFSPEAEAIAKFDWQPFKIGDFKLPEIKITATTYSGKKLDVAFPQYTVSVAPAPTNQAFTLPKENAFAYAFTVPPEIYVPSAQKGKKGLKDLTQLLALHKKERHSFPFLTSAYYDRRQLEEDSGLTPGPMEPSIPALVFFASLSFLLLLASSIFFFTKKIASHLAVFSLLIFFTLASLVTTFYFVGQANKKLALFTGGNINPIPEQGVESDAYIKAGTLLQIEKEAGEWVYIKYNDTRGWVLHNKLMLID